MDRMEGQMGDHWEVRKVGRWEDHLVDRMEGQMGGRSEDLRVDHWADHPGARTVVSGLPWEGWVVEMLLLVPKVLLGLLPTVSRAREGGRRRVRRLVVLLQQEA